MNAALWTCVALVSGTGAVLRYALHSAVQRRRADAFPLGTLAVNILGSLILGLLHGAGVSGDGALLVGTALLGSFTTFSTWMFETEFLADEDHGSIAAANVAISLVLGLAAVAAGWAVGAVL